MKNDIIYTNVVKLIKEGEDTYSEASYNVALNPLLNWMKFVLLDDLPNGNKQRIPKDEFESIIKTGINMPIKVSAGEISPGHTEAFPIGVITNLMVEENKIIGLAALWSTERPDDVKLLLDKYKKGEPLNISWELFYKEAVKNEEEEVEDLHGVTLTAATLVGIPAYKGRTNVFSMASEKQEEKNLEELEQLKIDKKNLEDKIATLEADLNAKVAEMETAIAELDSLKQYKEEVETVKQAEAKFLEIKTKFSEAGLEFEDKYFEERRDKLLSMSEESIDFFIQETTAFNKEIKEVASLKVPFLKGKKEASVSTSPAELAEFLRDNK